ncbi:hypothetical protein BCR34DRAFT_608794 [Clohesyomyces aquaticus]|uniref:NACHT domain-containing protein n=1 Tax=Clohesyomyces aquaticus TaxID=1231657 RepID=A0A1Y1Y4I4_9PLEO|nr:hypothetical protein BCR34DRAFT_608794 [Clohesyomyces aquaticus]
MVLDPLVAVGLAGNLVQFLDFSCKLFSETRKIYRTGIGAAEETREISQVTTNLRDLSSKLSSDFHGRQRGSNTAVQDFKLYSIASDCTRCADELLEALEKITTKDPPTLWKSFQMCLKTVWKQDRIEAMELRLDRLRSDLILAMQAMLSKNSSTVIAMLNELRETNRQLDASLSARIDDVKTGMVDALRKLLSEMQRQQSESTALINEEKFKDSQNKETFQLAEKHVHLGVIKSGSGIAEEVTESGEQSRIGPRNNRSKIQSPLQNEVDVQLLSQELSQNAECTKTIASELKLLSMLRYTTMEFRHSKIAEAHPNTFRQVFASRLRPWLESKDPIFWISGKAGSGKSTLMKYLIHNHETEVYLKSWAGNLGLIMSSYFFWINGTEIQRSQEGLIRSILYDILRRYPQLARPTFPDRWRLLSRHRKYDRHPFSRIELLEAFQRLVKHIGSSARICLFIDGLDEYDGDHEDLIQVIRNTADMPSVKLCVASRPWNVFESAFGRSTIHKLYLEQVNARDIRLYVKNKLQDRPDFIALQGRNDQAEALVNELIEKANGVFLWVYLVTRSLIQGLQNFDRISDMQRRLRSFPDDLDELFNRMLSSLDPIYQKQAARAFQLALSACRPMTALNYWFADVEEEASDFSIRQPVKALSDEELRSRNHEISKRLNARCKGFLEISTSQSEQYSFETRVDFLHRTVKDFLMTKSIQKLLSEWMPTDFDADLVLCRTILAEIKTTSSPVVQRDSPKKELVDDFFHSLTLYQRRHGVLLKDLLNDLLQTLSVLASSGLVAQQHRLSHNQREPWSTWGHRSFLVYAVSWDLYEVVATGIDDLVTRGEMERVEKETLLDTVLYSRRDRFQTQLVPNPRILACILQYGPQPRVSITQFNKTLRRQVEWRSDTNSIFQVLKMLCENGVNLGADPSSRELLSQIFTSADVTELFSIKPIAHKPVQEVHRRRRTLFRWPWRWCSKEKVSDVLS